MNNDEKMKKWKGMSQSLHHQMGFLRVTLSLKTPFMMKDAAIIFTCCVLYFILGYTPYTLATIYFHFWKLKKSKLVLML